MTIQMAIDKLEELNGWQFCGKTRKSNGLTYYCFVDTFDYLPNDIYCKVLKEYAQRVIDSNK